jgi:3-isopropylmalate/(R)-2-methylmalate dehydratase small subunit
MAKYEDLVGREDWLPALDGRAWTFGDRVARRVIVADEWLGAPAGKAARHVFEGLTPGFVGRMRPGDFVVAGEDFAFDATERGLPAALKAARIGAVIARSFGEPFARNALHLGLPALVVEETAAIKQGDRLRVDIEAHVVANKSSGDRYVVRNLNDEQIAILRAGGIIRIADSGPRRF